MTKAIEETSNAAGTADDVDTSTDDESKANALETDDDGWDDGEEIEDDADEEDSDSAATDDDDEDSEESDDDVEESEDSEEDDDSDADSTAAKDPEKLDAEQTEQQRRNDEAAKHRIAEKQQRSQAKSDAQAKYIAEGKDATERSLREVKIAQYNNRIETTTNQLRSGVLSARQNIDLFNSKEPAIKDSMYDAIDKFEAIFVEKDDNGDFLDIRIDPTTGEKADVQQYLAKEAERIKNLTGLGAKEQERAKKTQKKRTATLPQRQPVKKKVDEMLAGFDDEANS